MGMTFELKFRIRPVPVLVAIFVLARLNTGEAKYSPRDCQDVQLSSGVVLQSGVFTIYPANVGVKVFCDFDTDEGNWTVIQRRMPPVTQAIDFYRPWQNYVDGFGIPDENYWLGLENMHQLTSDGAYELRIDLEDWEGEKAYALYAYFEIANDVAPYYLYKLTAAYYAGTAGDSLARHNGMRFSTYDKNNGLDANWNCAAKYHGAWWYDRCHQSNLNGRFVVNGTHDSYADGINWNAWRGYYYSMKRAEMKIRRRQIGPCIKS